MKQRFVLDAWAILALIPAEEPAASRVRQLLEQAQADHVERFTSMINVGEVTRIVGRAAGTPEAYKALDTVRSLSLRILSATDEAVLAAARNRIEYPISYADAFAVAAAQEHQATLVTGDPELLRLDGPVSIEMLSRNRS